MDCTWLFLGSLLRVWWLCIWSTAPLLPSRTHRPPGRHFSLACFQRVNIVFYLLSIAEWSLPQNITQLQAANQPLLVEVSFQLSAVSCQLSAVSCQPLPWPRYNQTYPDTTWLINPNPYIRRTERKTLENSLSRHICITSLLLLYFMYIFLSTMAIAFLFS